jgi:flagellar biosynthetic protein FliR
MGFSMASAIDPQTGVSMPIISQFLSLLALMILLTIDMHHWLLLFINSSLSQVPLGGFLMQENLFRYTIEASSNMFLVGFLIAFPIIAITFLQDVIFGMLMKTMPQFNLLVIGFPIKIAFAFIALIAILASTMLVFKNHMYEAFNYLEMFF